MRIRKKLCAKIKQKANCENQEIISIHTFTFVEEGERKQKL
jgi:hypothetical protein